MPRRSLFAACCKNPVKQGEFDGFLTSDEIGQILPLENPGKIPPPSAIFAVWEALSPLP
jgi:hypothetical protein